MTHPARYWTLALQALLAALPCAAQDSAATGIIYGPHHAFIVSAPPGWILDNEAGKRMGLDAVFYPHGQTWRDAPAVMYVNPAAPPPAASADAGRVMRDDSARFAAESPHLRIIRAPPLRTSGKRVAYVRYYSGDIRGNFEAVAYIAESTVTPIIVLTARTRPAFDQALPAFRQLVQSYQFITSDVRFDRH